MSRGTTLLLLALMAVAMASDVIELDADNFKEGTMGEEMMLVEFYAPW